jgi:hypothetical protein
MVLFTVNYRPDGPMKGYVMNQVVETQRPDGSFIAAQAELAGYYTDCFSFDASKVITLAELIGAFYTTPLFRLERLVLALTPKGRMRDADVVTLANGLADRMAVWQVEDRKVDEILLNAGRTKSWLMVSPMDGGTRLFFGSVVVPEPPKRAGAAPRLGPVFDTLLGAHRVYSRLLLGAAAHRLP